MNTKITTKEFFEREKENGGLKPSNFLKEKVFSHKNSYKNTVFRLNLFCNLFQIIDPEKEFLEEELHLALVKEKRLQGLLENVQKVIDKGNSTNKTRVPIAVLVQVLKTADEKELQRIIDKYGMEPDNSTITVIQPGQPGQPGSNPPPNTTVCNIL